MTTWPALLLVLCASVSQISATAAAESPGVTGAPSLQTQIMRCFSPPPGATTPVTLTFSLAGDGTVSGAPQVVAQGTAAVDQAFAKAAARAITRCAPYTAAADTVTVTFAVTQPPGPVVSSPAARPTESTPLDIPIAGGTLTVTIPDGLCAVHAERSPAQATLWRAFTPPPQRGAKLLALAIDCPTLEQDEVGGRPRPRRVFTLLGGAAQAEPEPLEAYLAGLAERFSQREPLTDRFWQNPPAAGAPMVGRDARAVYVAQRQLRKSDGISVAGISGYTLVGTTPLIVNVLSMDGSDIDPQARATVAAVVERLHHSPSAR